MVWILKAGEEETRDGGGVGWMRVGVRRGG